MHLDPEGRELAFVETTWLLCVVGTQDMCPFRKMLCTKKESWGEAQRGSWDAELWVSKLPKSLPPVSLGPWAPPTLGVRTPAWVDPLSNTGAEGTNPPDLSTHTSKHGAAHGCFPVLHTADSPPSSTGQGSWEKPSLQPGARIHEKSGGPQRTGGE